MQTSDKAHTVAIDKLIRLVKDGHTIKTGIDIFSENKLLLLEKNYLVDQPTVLFHLKNKGIRQIPINYDGDGGIWNENGEIFHIPTIESETDDDSDQEDDFSQDRAITSGKRDTYSEVEQRILEINHMKITAEQKYRDAKKNIKSIIKTMQDSDGELDYSTIQETAKELFSFVSKQSSGFSYLTKEIFTYDDYLYNHSINVCAIGTAVAKKFSDHFSSVINASLNSIPISDLNDSGNDENQHYTCYYEDELYNISIGLFMHDLGKVLIDKAILNKEGRLTKQEFAVVKRHSEEKGGALLDKNNIANPFVRNITKYHHARLFNDESRCYPEDLKPKNIPPYVKICKLADIYDAMTSKRSYREAFNPVGAVSDIFHKYAGQDRILQYILHSFVSSIGIYPPGSIIALVNGQIVYVLDSNGPTVLPITDCWENPLQNKPDPIVIDQKSENKDLQVDRRKPPIAPLEAFRIIPQYLRDTITPH